jgi:TPR repeat protein
MRICLRLARFIVVSSVFIVSVVAQQSAPVAKLPIAQLQKLAESGDAAAQNELGIHYRLGDDVEKDPAKAVLWFLKAAKQGYAKAYFNLGAAYYNGDAVTINDSDACVWFMLAADAGDQRGQDALARTREQFTHDQMTHCELLAATAYLTGERVKQDYGKALAWYQKAADAKDGVACERLAYMYQRGLGVSANSQEGLKWLTRSADFGYVPAVYEVAYLYDKGIGVPPDITRAKKMYQTAAAGGQLEALLALGGMYEEGRGFKQDRQEALAYYLAAAQFGSPDGKASADKLSSQLASKQVAAAKEASKRIAALSRPQLALVRK